MDWGLPVMKISNNRTISINVFNTSIVCDKEVMIVNLIFKKKNIVYTHALCVWGWGTINIVPYIEDRDIMIHLQIPIFEIIVTT